MSKTRLLPYRTIATSDLPWGGWWLERNGSRAPLPDLLPGWDYAASDVIGITVEVETDKVLNATGIGRIDLIEAVAVVDCAAMLRRFITRQRLSQADVQQLELSLALPPGEVAHKVELSAYLLLAEDTPPSARTASRRGSRLGVGPSRSVYLEGDASRFPTEAVSFSALRLEDAPWTLSAVLTA